MSSTPAAGPASAPTDEAELAEAIAAAAASRAPLEIAGGGTRAGLGRPVQADRTLSTRGLSGIRLYEPGALTLVVGAGTPMAEVEAALAAEGQMLPFEPMDHRALLGTQGEPTIGGAVAVNASGPRRIQRGACRDAMIGVRFVDGSGRPVANGGRVMKNVTGLDLVKLMAGSHGTLGVVTQVGFKVLPAPEATATLLLRGLDDRAAVEAMSDALGSPFDVAGAAHLPDEDGPDEPATMIRLEGLERSVAYRTDKLKDRLSRFRPEGVETAPDGAALWRRVRDVEPLRRSRRAPSGASATKPSDGPALVEAVRAGGPLLGAFYDWGGGLVWLLVEEPAMPAPRRSAPQTRGSAATPRWCAPRPRPAPPSRSFEPEPAPLARISAGLRREIRPARHPEPRPHESLMQTNFTEEQLQDPGIARANQILRACVHCGFCTATCPTYQVLGDELDSPRGRIYLIKDMLENDRPADERTVKHLDRCLSCLACMTTCPSGVHYMHLVDHARAHIERTYRRPLPDRALRWLLARILPYPGRFRLALAGAKLGPALPPRLPARGCAPCSTWRGTPIAAARPARRPAGPSRGGRAQDTASRC